MTESSQSELKGPHAVPRPLEGVRVLEQGTFITGPCCAMMLADLGADVIKVEAPGYGDPFRAYQGNLYSAHFQAYNRNKRSVVLDMKTASDREVFDALLAESDVFIHNFRPGTAERLGIHAERLQALNPKLVYCSITGFGESGPYAGRPAYDSVAQALGGFLSVVVDPENPRLLGPAVADAITGIYAAYGVLGALVERGRTGRGRLVEVSMLEAVAHFAVEPLQTYFESGVAPTSNDRPRAAQAFLLSCADGKLIAIHLSSVEKFWKALLRATEAVELGDDPRFADRTARIEHYDALAEELSRIFKSRPRTEWIRILDEHDVPCGRVNNLDELENDPQVQHLGMIVPALGAGRTVRSPITYDGQRVRAVNAAPRLDEHGEEIRALRKWPRASSSS